MVDEKQHTTERFAKAVRVCDVQNGGHAYELS